MVKRIYFNIDELARDAVVAANLRPLLAQRGIDMEYGTRVRLHLLRRHDAFDAIICHNLDLIESLWQSPDNLNCPIILLPTEAVGVACADADRFAKTLLGYSYVDNVDRRWAEKVGAFCLWGQRQMDHLQMFAPQMADRFHLIGHPRHDRRCLSPGKPQRGPDGRIRVGFVTRFDPFNPFDDRPMVESLYKMRKSRNFYGFAPEDVDRDIEDIYYSAILDLRVMYDIMDRLDPATHEAIIRVHPRENRKNYELVIREWGLKARVAPWDQPFMHFIDDVDYVVGPPSTSFYDAAVAGKPVICIDRLVAHRQTHLITHSDDHSPLREGTLRPTSVEEVIDIVSRRPVAKVEQPPGIQAILRNEEYWPDCASSLDRMADACAQAVERFPRTKPTSFGAYAGYRIAAARADALPRRGSGEQSSNFRLTRARKAWIDRLAGQG